MAAPSIRGSTAPGSGLSVTSPSATQVGDMVVVVTWERAGSGIPDHTTQSGFVQIGSQGHEDGTTDGRLSVAYKIATSSGATSYQAYTTSGSGTVYTGCIVLYGHSTSGIVQASSTQTNNQVPNPPQVTGLTGDFLILIASGWHLATASNNTVAPGANYTEEWEVGVSTDLELGLATRALTGLSGASEDPPAWSDNVAPNGTSSITIAIKSAATYDESLTASAASGSAQTSTGTFNHAVPASSVAADASQSGALTALGATTESAAADSAQAGDKSFDETVLATSVAAASSESVTLTLAPTLTESAAAGDTASATLDAAAATTESVAATTPTIDDGWQGTGTTYNEEVPSASTQVAAGASQLARLDALGTRTESVAAAAEEGTNPPIVRKFRTCYTASGTSMSISIPEGTTPGALLIAWIRVLNSSPGVNAPQVNGANMALINGGGSTGWYQDHYYLANQPSRTLVEFSWTTTAEAIGGFLEIGRIRRSSPYAFTDSLGTYASLGWSNTAGSIQGGEGLMVVGMLAGTWTSGDWPAQTTSPQYAYYAESEPSVRQGNTIIGYRVKALVPNEYSSSYGSIATGGGSGSTAHTFSVFIGYEKEYDAQPLTFSASASGTASSVLEALGSLTASAAAGTPTIDDGYVPAGGSSYNETVLDTSVSSSDSASLVLALAASTTESAASDSTSSSLLTALGSTTESAAAGDAAVPANTLTASTTESVASSTPTIDDGYVPVGGTTYNETVLDTSVAASTSQSAALTAQGAISETASSDSATSALLTAHATTTESVAASSSQSTQLTALESLSESSAATSTHDLFTQFYILVTGSVAAAEVTGASADGLITFSAAAADAIAPANSVSVTSSHSAATSTAQAGGANYIDTLTNSVAAASAQVNYRTNKVMASGMLTVSSTGTQTISNLGFAPAAVILRVIDKTTLDTLTAGAWATGIGFGTSSTNRYCVAHSHDYAGSNPIAVRKVSHTRLAHVVNPSSTLIFEADDLTLGSDGFSFDVDTCSGSWTVQWCALWGTEAICIKAEHPDSGFSLSVTGVEFHPDLAFALSILSDSKFDGTIGANSTACNFGAIDNRRLDDATPSCLYGTGMFMTTAGGLSYTHGYLFGVATGNNHKWTTHYTGPQVQLGYTDDGVNIYYDVLAAGERDESDAILFIKGLEAKWVESLNWTTGTGTQAVTGLGFRPKALIIVEETGSTPDTADSNGVFGLGFYDGATLNSIMISVQSADFVDRYYYVSDTNVTSLNKTTMNTLWTVATVQSRDNDGWTWYKSTGPGSDVPGMWVLAIGGTSLTIHENVVAASAAFYLAVDENLTNSVAASTSQTAIAAFNPTLLASVSASSSQSCILTMPVAVPAQDASVTTSSQSLCQIDHGVLAISASAAADSDEDSTHPVKAGFVTNSVAASADMLSEQVFFSVPLTAGVTAAITSSSGTDVFGSLTASVAAASSQSTTHDAVRTVTATALASAACATVWNGTETITFSGASDAEIEYVFGIDSVLELSASFSFTPTSVLNLYAQTAFGANVAAALTPQNNLFGSHTASSASDSDESADVVPPGEYLNYLVEIVTSAAAILPVGAVPGELTGNVYASDEHFAPASMLAADTHSAAADSSSTAALDRQAAHTTTFATVMTAAATTSFSYSTSEPAAADSAHTYAYAALGARGESVVAAMTVVGDLAAFLGLAVTADVEVEGGINFPVDVLTHAAAASDGYLDFVPPPWPGGGVSGQPDPWDNRGAGASSSPRRGFGVKRGKG